jgi:uncharacterized protein (TIGR03435 family)
MRRAFLFLLIFVGLHASTAHAGAPSAADHRSAVAVHQVRIRPTELPSGETSIDIGPTQWTLQGYDLRGLLAHVYDINPARVDLGTPELLKAQQGDVAPVRYDVSLSLSGDESEEAIQTILRNALEERFHLKTSLESRSKDVYVLSAPAGAGSGLRSVASLRASGHRRSAEPSSEVPSMLTVVGRVCPGVSSAGITAQSATLDQLAAALADNLDRLVLDETNLTPAYDFQLPEYHSREELASLLHDRLGLTLTPGRREVKVLAVHSTGQAAGSLLAGI